MCSSTYGANEPSNSVNSFLLQMWNDSGTWGRIQRQNEEKNEKRDEVATSAATSLVSNAISNWRNTLKYCIRYELFCASEPSVNGSWIVSNDETKIHWDFRHCSILAHVRIRPPSCAWPLCDVITIQLARGSQRLASLQASTDKTRTKG